MKLCDLVKPGSIIAELSSVDRNGAIRELVQLLADQKLIDPETAKGVAQSIITRERTRGTTGFGKGVAVPHAKVDDQKQIVAAIGRSSTGIDFQSLDGQPVHAIFLIVSPSNQAEEHLRAMELVFGHLQQEKFRKFLRQLDTAEKIYDLLKEADDTKVVA